MRWESLERKVPYMLVFSKQYVPTPILGSIQGLEDAVWILHPGKHWQTWPTPGGDFKVKLRFGGRERMLTFRQVFEDWQEKRDWAVAGGLEAVMFLENQVARSLISIVTDGESPDILVRRLRRSLDRLRAQGVVAMPGLSLEVLLTSHQCMALAEHRRYGEQTNLGGGKYLLVRVVLGIVYGKWTAVEARQTTTGNDRSSGRRGGLGALEALEGFKGWDSRFSSLKGS